MALPPAATGAASSRTHLHRRAPLFHITEALVRVLPAAALPVAVCLLLAKVGQGREALFATPGLWLYAAFTFASVTVLCLGYTLLGEKRYPLRGSAVQAFARHYGPTAVALITAFLLPVLLEWSLRPGEQRPEQWPPRVAELMGMSLLLQMAAVFLLPALRYRRGLGPAMGAMLLVMLAVFVVVPWAWVRLLVVLVCLAAVDWRFRDELSQTDAKLVIATGAVLSGVWVVAAVWLLAAPLERAGVLGPALTLLIGLQVWMAAAYVWALAGPRWPWVAWAGIGAVAALLFLAGPFHRRAVRVLPANSALSRPPLRNWMDQWLTAREPEIRALPGSQTYPVFLVGAAGGGIRAAYWTAAVLSGLTAQAPEFGAHVLAISGVSGGSLGASVYAAGLRAGPAATLPSRTLRVLSADLLSPALASMMMPEAARSVLQVWPPADRAAALEQAVEQAWRQATNNDIFAEPLEHLWAGSSRTQVPLVIWNCTTAQGRHAALGPVTLEGALEGGEDLGRLAPPGTLRLSTATLLSARFPLISPTALVAGQPVLDGGYFDNSGSATVASMLEALQTAVNGKGLQGRVQPVVLLVGNEAESEPAPAPSPLDRLTTLLSRVADPLQTISGVWSGQAERLIAELQRRAAPHGVRVLTGFRPRRGAVPYPLGWMLAEDTRRELDRVLKQQSAGGDFAEVRRLLQHAAPPSNSLP